MCTKKKVWLTQELRSPRSSFVFPQNLIAHLLGSNLSYHVPADTQCAPVGVVNCTYWEGMEAKYVSKDSLAVVWKRETIFVLETRIPGT